MKPRLVEWLARYLPLEIAATVCALAGGLGAAALVDNGAVVAYAATWAENAGFYAVALVREVRQRLASTPATAASVGAELPAALRTLIAEFGPAEALDSFVVRPAAMLTMPMLTGDLAWGLLIGKIVADLAFYALAIVAYEWRKLRRR